MKAETAPAQKSQDRTPKEDIPVFKLKNRENFVNTAAQSALNPYQEPVKAGDAMANAAKDTMDAETLEALKALSEHRGKSAVLLENVPIGAKDVLPATPKDTKEPQEKDRVSELYAMGVTRALGGVPDAEKMQAQGSAISQIIPLKPDAYTGEGYRKGYEYHSEAVSRAEPPEYTILTVLKGDQAAKTGSLGVDEIIKNLPVSTVKALEKSDFVFRSSDAEGAAKDFRAPVLSKNQSGAYQIRYNDAPFRTLPATPEAELALQELRSFMKTRASDGLVLKAGQMLVMDNLRSLHRRGGFEPTTNDADKRWLQRIYLKNEKPVETAKPNASKQPSAQPQIS